MAWASNMPTTINAFAVHAMSRIMISNEEVGYPIPDTHDGRLVADSGIRNFPPERVAVASAKRTKPPGD